MKILKNKRFLEIMKFGINGGLGFIIDFYLLYVLTHWFNIHYLLSSTISFIVSLLVNYLLCAIWVFKGDTVDDGKNVRRLFFVVTSVIGLLINALIMYTFVEFLLMNYLIVKIISAGVVMVWNYFTKRVILTKRIIKKDNGECLINKDSVHHID